MESTPMSRIRNCIAASWSTDPRSKSRNRNVRFAPEFLDRRLSPSSLLPADLSMMDAEVSTMEDPDPTPTPDGDGEPPIVVTPPPVGPSGPGIDASDFSWCP
jgi:hypothetical protein